MDLTIAKTIGPTRSFRESALVQTSSVSSVAVSTVGPLLLRFNEGAVREGVDLVTPFLDLRFLVGLSPLNTSFETIVCCVVLCER